jgi:hypothetical protein
MESCQKCGHIRYAGDLFDGGCSDCCDWMVARLAELTAERDALKAKLAEAARLARDSAKAAGEIVGQQWQPIETAPKDGSEILAHRHDCGVLIASWREPAEFMTDDEIESSDLPADELYSPCWFAFGSWGVSQIGDGDLFTSWMPLPEPPAILNDAREGGE